MVCFVVCVCVCLVVPFGTSILAPFPPHRTVSFPPPPFLHLILFLLLLLAALAVANIWFGVSQFVAKAITEGKGVNVNGLGTFALSVVDDRTPIFQLSEQFVKKHDLQATTKPTASSSPIISLNYSEIARATDNQRDDVERCFSEIMAVSLVRMGACAHMCV